MMGILGRLNSLPKVVPRVHPYLLKCTCTTISEAAVAVNAHIPSELALSFCQLLGIFRVLSHIYKITFGFNGFLPVLIKTQAKLTCLPIHL